MDKLNLGWRDLTRRGYCIDLGDSWASRRDQTLWADEEVESVRGKVGTLRVAPTGGVELRPVSRVHVLLTLRDGQETCTLIEYRDYQFVQEL